MTGLFNANMKKVGATTSDKDKKQNTSWQKKKKKKDQNPKSYVESKQKTHPS